MSLGVFPVLVSSAQSSVELEYVASVLALTELRVYRETLSKVLEVLYEAEKRGWSLRQVIDLIGEWLSEAELRERMLLEEADPLYQRMLERLGAGDP